MPNLESFKEIIWSFYHNNRRSFLWRDYSDNPYYVLVSEIMLQQTQTSRVIEKFTEFIEEFPTIYSLAEAPLRNVLSIWQGLGYNRRGKFLHDTAQIICNSHNGIIPNDPSILVTFPGIGKNTAGSICAFAYNMPTVFIETNIRSVFIHHFYSNEDLVHDNRIESLVAATVDHLNPREWYYALMDYGVMLKQTTANPSRKSKHHIKQSKFEGSDRQIRGAIIRYLTEYETITLDTIYEQFANESKDRIENILKHLHKDKLVFIDNENIRIT